MTGTIIAVIANVLMGSGQRPISPSVAKSSSVIIGQTTAQVSKIERTLMRGSSIGGLAAFKAMHDPNILFQMCDAGRAWNNQHIWGPLQQCVNRALGIN